MNRAQRRALARRPDPRICEHGNPKKTDGNGNPVCPHGCGFPHHQHNQRIRNAIARVFDIDMTELDSGPLDEVMHRLTTAVVMPRQHGRPQTAVTKAIGKYASITAPPDYQPVDYTGRGA